MRISCVSVALIFAMPVFAQTSKASPPNSFCARLADETGMTAERVGRDGQPRVWSTRMFNLAQRFLVGGQAMVTLQIMPAADATVADYARLTDACKSVGKATSCAIEGPAGLRLGINGKEARATAVAGEKAQVEIVGSRVICRDGT
jgi:hypothetical protein